MPWINPCKLKLFRCQLHWESNMKWSSPSLAFHLATCLELKCSEKTWANHWVGRLVFQFLLIKAL